MAVLAAGTGDVKDETKILWRTKVQFITHMSCYNLFIKCKKKNRLWEIVVLATERIREGRMQPLGQHGRVRHGRQGQGDQGYLPGRHGDTGITDTRTELALGYGRVSFFR